MTIFEVLYKEIGADVEILRGALNNNRVVDIEDYRHITGQLRGLSTALMHIKGLEIKINNDELED